MVDGDGANGSHQDIPYLRPQVLPPGTAMDWVLRAALEAHAAKRLPMQVPFGEYFDEHSQHSGFYFPYCYGASKLDPASLRTASLSTARWCRTSLWAMRNCHWRLVGKWIATP